jgi:hypothetical protein
MTSPRAIYTVGSSLVSYLTKAWEAQKPAPAGITKPEFKLMSSGDFAGDLTSLVMPTISLFLFRVTVNEHLRNIPRASLPSGRAMRMEVPLSLDLHYLLSVWSDKAEDEHFLLAWTMQELYLRPVLDGSSLIGDAQWQPEDVVQILPAELSTEDIMRIWDALEPSYRLSVSYVARVLRIDGPLEPAGPPVAARRFAYLDETEP